MPFQPAARCAVVRGRTVLLTCAVALAVLAGCTTPPPFAGSFEDADRIIDGSEGDKAVGFLVPEGNVTLRVAIRYAIETGTYFEAQVYPEGRRGEFVGLTLDGPASERDPDWVVIRNATAGPWTFSARVDGEGAFRAGAYFD